MASIINLAATTELEAVNAMLSAIGEAPIADVDAATAADAAIAISTLRNACREVQALGWKFNTEHGVAVAPAVLNFSWTDPDGVAILLDIFTPPTGLIAFTLTPLSSQTLSSYGQMLDVILRPSKQYAVSAAPVMVFYDRARNRDGFPATENRDFLYIDPVWLFNFTHMPETARRYVLMLATRRFVQSALGDVNLVSFQETDERLALRALARDQGVKDTTSLLDHPDTFRILGGRMGGAGLFSTQRSRPVVR